MEKLNKVQTLELAGLIAPIVRDRPATAGGRRVKVTDNEGKVIREITAAELLEKQLLRQGIEIDTKIEPGKWPKALRCACGMPYMVPPKPKGCGRYLPPRQCAMCEKDRWTCPNLVEGQRCNRPITCHRPFSPSSIKRRKGEPAFCAQCSKIRKKLSVSKARLALPVEKRKENINKWLAIRTAADVKKQGEARKKANEKLTAKERKEIGERLNAAVSLEDRKERGKKGRVKLTPEQCAKGGKRGSATRWGNRSVAPDQTSEQNTECKSESGSS